MGGVPMVADVGDGPLALLQKLRLPWAQARAPPRLLRPKPPGHKVLPRDQGPQPSTTKGEVAVSTCPQSTV